MKRLAVASALVALALAATACSSSTDPTAVTVNGKEAATVQEVQDTLAAFANLDCEPDTTGTTAAGGTAPDTSACQQLKSQVQGSGSGTANADFAGAVVTAFINTELMRQEAQKRNLVPTEADIDTARDTAWKTFGADEASGNFVLDQLPQSQQDYWAERIALFDKLSPVLDAVPDEQVQTTYEQNAQQFT
jgi:hypothetical protein